MDAAGVITGNRIYPTKLKSLSGLLVFFHHVKYDTKEIDDRSIRLIFSFANNMVSRRFL